MEESDSRLGGVDDRSSQDSKNHESVNPSDSTDELDGSPILSQVLGPALGTMKLFHAKLAQEGEIKGLIGPRELPRLWERHILNSAALAPFIRKEQGATKDGSARRSLTIADVGSGAGFPGIVLAAMFPKHRFTLIEPMERRVEWLEELVDYLSLTNVHIVRDRAEDVHQYFDVVTCRAVAPMTKLSHWVFPLIKSNGMFIALKGRSAQEEIEKAAKEIRKMGGVSPQVHEAQVGPGLEPTHVVTVKRR